MPSHSASSKSHMAAYGSQQFLDNCLIFLMILAYTLAALVFVIKKAIGIPLPNVVC